MSVPATAFALQAHEADVNRFRVSDLTTKTFCARCGSTLYHVTRGYEGTIGLLAGSLNGSPPLRPTGHYFYSDRAPWTAAPCDGLPLYGGDNGYQPIER